MTTATGEIELPHPHLRPISHRRSPLPLRCRIGLHDWLRVNGRYRCLRCPALRHPD